MNEEICRAIGVRLKEFRVSLGMTQSKFASELKAKRQSVTAWEAGRALPRCEAWLKLGEMGMSLDYAVLGIRNVPVSGFARPVVLSPACRSCAASSGTLERLPTS